MSLQIGVIGGSVCTPEFQSIAYRVGYLVAQAGAVLVCGGLGGVMEQACRGAKDAGGTTVGIIPSLNPGDANPHVDVVIPTGFGLARNVLVVRASDAVIAVDGYIGTLSEIAFALNEGRTVVGIGSWRLEEERISNGRYVYASSPEEAVEIALEEARRRRDSYKSGERNLT